MVASNCIVALLLITFLFMRKRALKKYYIMDWSND
jgi:hypothetical protein